MRNKYTFWELLSEKQIIIPIIQRDYAQGRDGKEYIRKNFLEQLGKALGLIESKDEKDKIAELDFIYGTELRMKNECDAETVEMLPLDGQQRLTTLWLLHWYVAYKSGELKTAEVKNTLKKFTYETRASSREFCNKICDLTYQENPDEKITDYITKHTWYYSAWNQDPTIKSMLCMLSGTDNSKEKNGEFIDGIEELFIAQSDYASCWEKLTSSKCSIHFNFLPLLSEELPVSDDLYIKMNARGKALTNFENFKANLVEWIYQEDNRLIFGNSSDLIDENRAKFTSLIDNQWTDAFWGKEKINLDKKYYSFLNRYFLNQAIASGLVKTEDNKVVSGKPIWDFLYGDKSDDSKVEYQGFSIYESILNHSNGSSKSQSILNRLEKVFEGIKDVQIESYLPEWAILKYDKFKFIPGYTNNNISTLTQPQRVLFHAICRYFEITKFDEFSFKRWMRVSCSLINNTTIETIDAMIGRLKLIDEISIHSGDIYKFLASDDSKINYNTTSKQVEEEREKAIQIMGKSDFNLINAESLIIESESYAFFEGAIRFLFTNENGGVEWNDFVVKWDNVQSYFDSKGTKYTIADFKLLRRFISCFENENDFKAIYYDNSIENWRRWILLNSKLTSKVHNLLMSNDFECFDYKSFTSEISDGELNYLQNYLVQNIAVSMMEKGTVYHYWDGSGCILYPSKAKAERRKYVITPRIDILLSLRNNPMISFKFADINQYKQEHIDCKLLWSKNIRFFYTKDEKLYTFQWQHWNWIDMYEGENRLYDRGGSYMQLVTHYNGIEKESFTDPNTLIKEMDRCIEVYEKIKSSELKNTP